MLLLENTSNYNYENELKLTESWTRGTLPYYQIGDMENPMPAIPQWAKDQRQKGTEIKVIGGRYYLSKVTSKWDPTIKRARKISGDYLGVLTPDGLIPVHHKMLRLDEPVLSKEFGASWLLASLTGDIREHLRTRFPDIWRELYAICLARTVRPCAFRYIAQRYENSILSEALPGLALSGASITTLLNVNF